MDTIALYTTATTLPAPADAFASVTSEIPLAFVAAVLLCVALAVMQRALKPFRELLRALMAAGLAGALVFAALVLLVTSMATGL